MNNSVYFSGAGPSRGIYPTSVPAGQMHVIKNNLVYVTGSSTYPAYPLYLGTAFSTTLYDIDYNNMYAMQVMREQQGQRSLPGKELLPQI